MKKLIKRKSFVKIIKLVDLKDTVAKKLNNKTYTLSTNLKPDLTVVSEYRKKKHGQTPLQALLVR